MCLRGSCDRLCDVVCSLTQTCLCVVRDVLCVVVWCVFICVVFCV